MWWVLLVIGYIFFGLVVFRAIYLYNTEANYERRLNYQSCKLCQGGRPAYSCSYHQWMATNDYSIEDVLTPTWVSVTGGVLWPVIVTYFMLRLLNDFLTKLVKLLGQFFRLLGKWIMKMLFPRGVRTKSLQAWNKLVQDKEHAAQLKEVVAAAEKYELPFPRVEDPK